MCIVGAAEAKKGNGLRAGKTASPKIGSGSFSSRGKKDAGVHDRVVIIEIKEKRKKRQRLMVEALLRGNKPCGAVKWTDLVWLLTCPSCRFAEESNRSGQQRLVWIISSMPYHAVRPPQANPLPEGDARCQWVTRGGRMGRNVAYTHTCPVYIISED
jgi:hypothetical protein